MLLEWCTRNDYLPRQLQLTVNYGQSPRQYVARTWVSKRESDISITQRARRDKQAKYRAVALWLNMVFDVRRAPTFAFSAV